MISVLKPSNYGGLTRFRFFSSNLGIPTFYIVFRRFGEVSWGIWVTLAAPSSNPMEASPLDLRSVTVIPRALPEAIRGDDDATQQPSEHQQPPADIAPRVVR